ncbi:hypothetical protein GC194_06510 [bacterium]|nr:hypothetical protein [bacterium]
MNRLENKENTAHKSAKKRRRWWLWLLCFPVGLWLSVVGIWFYLAASPSGQMFVTNLGNKLLHQYVSEKASIGYIQLEFPPKISLSNVVIYDHRDSILFKAEALKLTPVWPPVKDSVLQIDQVVISHFEANMKNYEGEELYNYEYVFDMNSTSTDSTKSAINAVEVRKLIFEEGNFCYADYNQKAFRKPGEKGIDFYRLKTGSINGILDSIQIDDGVSASLKGFSVRESSGFVVRELDAQMQITDTSFVWNHLDMRTNTGDIQGNVAFIFENWKVWKDFNDSVNMQINLKPSEIYFNDLAYFAPEVEGLFTNVKVSGETSGHLSNFRVRNLAIETGTQTHFLGNVKFTGLPDIKTTFIMADVSDSKILTSDLNRQMPGVDLPAELDRLGMVSFKGEFVGFIRDFVANGTFVSNLGRVQSDIKVKLAENAADNIYSGNLNLYNFKLGSFLNQAEIGTVNFVSTLNASGNEQQNLKAEINSEIKSFQYMGYNYQNVKVNGKVANRYFNGSLTSADPNALLDVIGKIDFSGAAPNIDLSTHIANLALNNLHLSKDTIVLKTDATMNFKGDKLETFVGDIKTENLYLTVNGTKYETGKTNVSGELIEGGKRWTLNSDFAEAKLETSLYLADLGTSLQQHGLALLPKDMGFEIKPTNDQIRATVLIKQPEILNSVLPKNLKLAQNSQMQLTIDDTAQVMLLSYNGAFLAYQNLYFNQPELALSKKGQSLKGHLYLSHLLIDSTDLSNYQLDFFNDSTQLYFAHKGQLNDTLLNFSLNHKVAYATSTTAQMAIQKSLLVYEDDSFALSCDSIQWEGSDAFRFKDLNLHFYNEKITAGGYAKLNDAYDINYRIDHINIDKITPFLPEYFQSTTGELNGSGHISSRNGMPLVEASLQVSPFNFMDLDIESIDIESHYNQASGILVLNSDLVNHQGKDVLQVSGGIAYSQTPTVDLIFSLDKVPNKTFEPLAVDVVSDLAGTASGQIQLTGELNKPALNGWLALDSTQLHVDYLGTDYSLTDTFEVNSNNIVIKRLVLTDKRGYKGVVSGKITHDMMSRFDLDLAMKCNNFHLLNTNEADNDLYYGQFFATGTAGFKGPMLQANVSCDLLTEKGTRFYLPIQEDQGYSQQSFIRFVNKEEGTDEYRVNDQDFSLDLNINLTTDAETQLIFDKQLGDIIKATGNGRIDMKLSPAGEFQMFGDYIIDQGNYLFTAFDLINKRFEIERGSKISWVGDPYDALIDIKANYYLKANAYSLASSMPQYNQSGIDQYKTPVPVVAYALLKGSLLNPVISLDFSFIDEGNVDVASLQRELDNMHLSEEERTKQVVSLLVLNRFMPMYTNGPTNGDIFGSTVNAGLGDLISNQLTYWLSSISDDLQVNVNYRSAYQSDGIVLTQSELELALSTTLFNDRVSVNFAYELQNGYSPNKEIAYKVNPDGTVKVLVFQRQTQNPVITYNSNTYGFGLFLKREFEHFKDLFKKQDPKKE